ncbi:MULTISPECIES: rhodanese-like domain-containing protein [unclassified Granulicatella]|uniref:rhodanese-like domain-containing protein n=1 Tax=unclassified Granulicatella TaxID=2630493 RepID=UPI0010730B4E|nr:MULTISPECIES: rhodanese-like domain-containing protein [unclassified Granulicatella]MBF0780486.1 rhodanese-like domain-containing protein [Granulicatella sp. 19428wC4_WM01]TFU95345.1 rhodanese-like domain-containing protein [Granulicatella sp. WM01]
MKQEEFKDVVAKGGKVIDVSDASRFAESHIEGAINIPLEELEERLAELDKNEEYHVVCRLGIKSEKATEILTQKGYHVHNVEGGMNDWNGEVVSE